MKTQRPMFLNLMQIKFPPMAIASILHRVTGVLMFLFLPVLLYLLSLSLASPESFQKFLTLTHVWWMQFLLWGGTTAASYHVIAGIRHLIMDLGIGESLAVARRTATLVISLGAISAILLGVWIW